MVTLRQKAAFDKVVENGGNISRAMMEVDYSPATAKTPQKLTESKGWKTLCEQAGLTDDFLIKALKEDIEKKPQNRKPELELGFKVIGRLKENPQDNKTLILMVSGESAQRFNVQPTRYTEDSGD